jgi:spore coat polysaccharide biosynthesis protein SpsF (cytidylyltransferase family)
MKQSNLNISNNKVAVLIAVRMKSTRLPKKALLIIEDQTLVEHIIDRMKHCKRVDFVMLCTSTHPDDQILLKIADMKGVLSFAGSEDDVMQRFLDAAKKVEANIIVRVTGDNPLTSPSFIDNAIDHHMKTNSDYTYTTELPQGTKGEVISISALERAHKLAENTNFSEYMTWYFIENPSFFKIEKVPVSEDMKRPHYRLTVDTPEDFELIKIIYRKMYKPGKIISLKEVIKFLDNNPALLKINSNIKIKNMEDKVNVKLKCQK